MSDAVSFAEIDEQQAELLPERTVMSVMLLAEPGGNAGDGGDGKGGIGAAVASGIGILAPGNAIVGSGIGGEGGTVNPAPAS